MSQPPVPPQPGQPYQQMPYPPQQPVPAKKKWYKRPLTWIIAAIVVIAIAVNGGSGNPDPVATDTGTTTTSDVAPDPEDAAVEQAAPAMAAMGEAISVGDVEYVVRDVEYGVMELGSDYVSTTPQGQFVIVSLDMKNNGTSALSFSDDMVVLLDGEVEYSASTDAWAYLEESVLYEQINPGNTLSAQIAFDIPTDAQPTAAKLSEGFWGTNTVDVALP